MRRARARTVKNTGDGIQETGVWRETAGRCKQRHPPSSKVSNAAWRGVACDAHWIWSLQCRLLAVLHLGRGIQIKQKVTARQSRNPEPTKRYQLHAEDAEECRGHKTLNPRLCVPRRPLRENPPEIARRSTSAVTDNEK